MDTIEKARKEKILEETHQTLKELLNMQTRTAADFQLILGSIQDFTQTINKLEKSHLQSLVLQEKHAGILEKMEKKFTELTMMVNVMDQKVGPGEDEAIEPGFVFCRQSFR